MRTYLVFMPADEGRVEKEFSDANFKMGDGLWAIGTEILTAADVCERLGMNEDSEIVVVPIRDYYGRFDRALWQKLEAWGSL